MSGLPDNWEADYDGRRWFYKYKPTGHVQYHFPKEGDEFPDFIDSYSPVPDLAPEERLESQQQVRRHGSTTTVPAKLSPKKDDGGYGMSATARPVSMTWDGSYEEEHTVFQPENFMYLGPGTYTDVSPLAEEEEEAAKRAVAGGIDGRFDKSPSKGVSPLNSEKTTPAQSSSHTGPIAEPVLVPPTVVEEIHEMPSHELPRAPDPVGIIAEMPTYDTAQAHIETNPPQIEMGDNTVLAPIETAAPMMAELPEKSSPVGKKKDEPQLAPGSLRNYSLPMQPLRSPPEPVEETPGIQSYKPENRIEIPPHPAPLRRSTFQPGYMANASPIQPPGRGHSGTPNVLSPPKVPPKRPLDEPAQPQIPPKHAFDQSSQFNLPPGAVNNVPYIPGQEPALSHMPSVLKPARGKGPGQPSSQPAPGPSRGPQGHGYVPPMPGKHPASMTPAPIVQQQRLEEPRMGVQRVNTVPDSLPSQRPQSLIQNGQQGMPHNAANRPLMQNRPISVLPDMGMQPQAQYQSPVESVPSRGLPRSATAGPTTPFPPYPVDNLPYPDDQPPFRREAAPYPEEPFMQQPIVPNQGPVSPSPPIQNNRRHSSYGSSMVSPDSRHGSMSFPLQSPSPMEHSRRASTTSNQIPNYTPSPVSQNSTPPSAPANQYQQGSYFHMPDGESHGYNNAARDALRKQSLGRGVDPRRNSAGADPFGAQRGSPLSQQNAQGYNAVSQALPHLQSPPQISQINAGQQNQRPDAAPTPPPQGQQSLGRIEEYEEAPSGTISRSSTASITSEMRKGSFSSSAQPSPMGSRRASLQSESPRNIPSGQLQGQQGHMLQGYTGQLMPQAQTPQGAPMPPQNPKQLQRKPSQGSVPQLQGRQMPTHDPRMAQGMPQQQGPGPQGQPIQSQMPPPQAQGRPPHPGQINTQVQHGPQGPTSSVLPPKPVPTRLQKRSSYGPPSPAGQMAPNAALQGPLPPSLKAQNLTSGQITPPGQPNVLQKMPTGRVQPHVQIPQDQGSWQPSPHPVMPQNQRPVSMQPGSSQSAGAKEGKEGKKWLKWLKGGSKSVSHSPTTPIISSPISSPIVGRPGWDGEFQQQAVWQPGQPMAAGPQPGPQGNLPPSQSMYMQPQHMQMAPQQQMQPQPARRASYSFQLAPEPNQMGFNPNQPGQMPMYSEQMSSQAGQLPPQRRYSPPQQGQTPTQQGQMSMQQGQAPPPRRYSPPQQMQTPIQQRQVPIQQGQTPPHQGQRRPQSEQLSFQKRVSLQQTLTSGRFENNAPMVAQAPPPGPGTMPRQPSPQGQPTGVPSMTGPPVRMSSNNPEPVINAPVGATSNNVPRQQPTPPRQPSPGQIRPLQQLPRQQPTPPRQPSPGHIRPLQQAPSPQPSINEPSQSPQTSASNHLQHDTVTNDVPSPHSLAGVTSGTPISRMSSTRSYFSDAGSITTIEVAQAQTQPVLKPSIVQVKRRSTDMLTQSHDVPSSSDATPRISEEIKRLELEPPSPPSNLQQQRAVPRSEPTSQVDVPKDNGPAPLPSFAATRPEPTSQADVPKDNVPAPLFSTSNAPKTVQPDALAKLENKEPASPQLEQPSPVPANNFVPDQQNNLVEAKKNEVQPEPAKPALVVEDKWAKKPTIDYSGGDWGDDDDWDY